MLKHLELTSKQFTMTIYCAKSNFLQFFFRRLIDGHFENGPSQVTWCDVYKVVKSVMSKPDSNNFVPPVQLLPKFTSEKNKIRSILL